MATVRKSLVEAKLTILLELDETEVRALDGIFGYNVESFLRVFYERMGEVYVKPHEAGVRSLHKTVRAVVRGPLSTVDKARSAMYQATKNPDEP